MLYRSHQWNQDNQVHVRYHAGSKVSTAMINKIYYLTDVAVKIQRYGHYGVWISKTLIESAIEIFDNTRWYENDFTNAREAILTAKYGYHIGHRQDRLFYNPNN